MGNITNTKPFHKLTRVWGSTNSVRSADSYAEYLAAALARGDGRSPGSLANLVTCFVEGGSVPSQTAASTTLTHTESGNTFSKHSQWPLGGSYYLGWGWLPNPKVLDDTLSIKYHGTYIQIFRINRGWTLMRSDLKDQFINCLIILLKVQFKVCSFKWKV